MIHYPNLDAAVVGVVERFGQPPIICYDYDKAIDCLVGEGMTTDEAVGFFEFNTLGEWVGEGPPCFLHKMELDEAEELYGEGSF